jgi:hypothetical protein
MYSGIPKFLGSLYFLFSRGTSEIKNCSSVGIPETIVEYPEEQVFCNNASTESTVSHSVQMGVFCEDPTGDFYSYSDVFFECGARSSKFANLDGNGQGDERLRFTCNEDSTLPVRSTNGTLQSIPPVSIRTDAAWVDIRTPGCLRDAPPPLTAAPTSLCQLELNDVATCIAASNPDCATCINALDLAARGSSCDSYERQLCAGYEECKCESCETNLNAYYSCVQEEFCDAFDCSSVADWGNMAGIIGGAVAVVVLVCVLGVLVCVLGLVAWIMRRRFTQSSGPVNYAKPTLTSNENNNNFSSSSEDARQSESYNKPDVASVPEPTPSPIYASHETQSGSRLPERVHVPEPDIEMKTQSSETSENVNSVTYTPSNSNPVASNAASYMPAFKDQARSVVAPSAVQSYTDDSPQSNSQWTKHPGGSVGSKTSAGASSGKKSTEQMHTEETHNMEIPTATVIFPVEAEHVSQVESVSSRHDQLEP